MTQSVALDSKELSDPTTDWFVRFRNYTPRDKSVGRRLPPVTIVASIERQLEERMNVSIKSFLEKDPLSQLNVKRVNADLKRDIEVKLNLLAPQTNEALLQLIKMNLATNKFNEVAQSKLIEQSIQHKISQQNSLDEEDE